MAYLVYEGGRKVGYITARRSWFEFVATDNYSATGKAAAMAETAAATARQVAAELRKAGLEVRRA